MYTDFTCLKSRTKSQLLVRLVTGNGKLIIDTDEDSWKRDKSIWSVLTVSLQRTAKLGLSNTEDRHRIQLVGCYWLTVSQKLRYFGHPWPISFRHP